MEIGCKIGQGHVGDPQSRGNALGVAAHKARQAAAAQQCRRVLQKSLGVGRTWRAGQTRTVVAQIAAAHGCVGF